MALVGGKRTAFLPMLVPGKEGSFPLLSKMRCRKCASPLPSWGMLLSTRELPWHSGFVAMVANTAELCCSRAGYPHVGEGFATALAMML